MPSFFEQDPKNPYLPSGGQQLSQLLMSLGAGFSMAGANNQPWWAGIAPGAAMYGQAQQQAQQNALAMQQRDENLAYRKLQEEQMRAVIDERKAAIEARKNYQPLGLGVGGGAPSTASQPPVGMAVPPKPPVMGGGQNIPQDYATRVAGYEGGTKNGGMVYNELGSGAGGPFQFMPATWADVRAKNPDLNLPETMPVDGRPETMAMHKAAFDRFTQGNAQVLQSAGIAPTSENLYLAHRFGAGGAIKMLQANPNAMLSDVLPVEWQAQNPDMRGQTVGGFQRLATERMGGVGVPYRANFETTQYQDGLPLIPPVTAPPPSIAPVPQPSPIVKTGGSIMDAVGPMPTPQIVPTPGLPPEEAQRIQQAVRAGQLTPAQGDAEARNYVETARAAAQAAADKQHAAAMEAWKLKYGEEKARREAADKSESFRQATPEEVMRYTNGQQPPPGSIFQINNKTGQMTVSGAPLVNMPGQESTALRVQIEAANKAHTEQQESAKAARSGLAQINRVSDLMDQISTGKFASTTLEIKAMAKSLGIDLGALGIKDDVGPAQAADALSKQLTLAMRDPSSGGGMPGAMSDADRIFLSKMVPTLETSPEGRKMIVEYAKRMYQRQIDLAKIANDYLRSKEFANDPSGMYAKMQEYADKNPLFSDKDVPAGGMSPAPAGAIPQGGDLYDKYGLKRK